VKTQQTSLDRGLRLLTLLHARGELRLSQLIDELASSRATVFRALSTLQEHGFVEHDRGSRTYRLGPALRSRQPVPVTQHAAPALQDLVDRSGETAVLAVVQARRIRYAAVLEGTFGVRYAPSVGDEVPVHASAAGKAVLAALTSAQREGFLGPDPYPGYTPRTLVRRAPLEWDLESTMERGYAVDDQEMETGTRGIAAAIIGPRRRPIAAMVVAGPSVRLGQTEVPPLGRAIVEWCDSISHRLAEGS
jgi:IclR family acetate operon transcriptional repressor